MIGLVVILSLALAACTSSAAASNPSATIPAAGGDTVQGAKNPKFGQLLVTADGRTLYTFAIDSSEASKCTSESCTSFWPPYVVSAQPTAGSGITGTLDTITRSDGAMQVTYNGMPLYTFVLDKKPGDVQGDGVYEFGGFWYVVRLDSPSAANSKSNGARGGYGY